MKTRCNTPLPEAIENPHLLMTEKKRDYEEFAEAVQKATKPNDVIENIYTMDFARNQWERERYRRFNAKFFDLEYAKRLRRALLDAKFNPDDVETPAD